MSAQKVAERKAAKEEVARQKEMLLLQKTRQQLPCDSVKIIEGKTVYLLGDSIQYPVYVSGDTIIKWLKCPPSKNRVDTFVKLDQAALQALRDSLATSEYRWTLMLDQYNNEVSRGDKAAVDLKAAKEDKSWWETRAIATWAVLGLLIVGAIVSKIKGII